VHPPGQLAPAPGGNRAEWRRGEACRTRSSRRPRARRRGEREAAGSMRWRGGGRGVERHGPELEEGRAGALRREYVLAQGGEGG
jgi:hypothetical protein